LVQEGGWADGTVKREAKACALFVRMQQPRTGFHVKKKRSRWNKKENGRT